MDAEKWFKSDNEVGKPFTAQCKLSDEQVTQIVTSYVQTIDGHQWTVMLELHPFDLLHDKFNNEFTTNRTSGVLAWDPTDFDCRWLVLPLPILHVLSFGHIVDYTQWRIRRGKQGWLPKPLTQFFKEYFDNFWEGFCALLHYYGHMLLVIKLAHLQCESLLFRSLRLSSAVCCLSVLRQISKTTRDTREISSLL